MRANIKVVGMKAGGREHVVAHVSTGDPVLLVPEPTNPHDPNAIAVYTAPRGTLQQPDALVSSITDEDRVGHVAAEDRVLLMDRQAGYVPRTLAAEMTLPPDGIVGYVSQVRFTPPEYDRDGKRAPARVAGFDVAAWVTRGAPTP